MSQAVARPVVRWRLSGRTRKSVLAVHIAAAGAWLVGWQSRALAGRRRHARQRHLDPASCQSGGSGRDPSPRRFGSRP